MKQRLDVALANRGLTDSRSQAENLIKLGQVRLNGVVTKKPSVMVDSEDKIKLTKTDRYVSRAGLKLASVADALGLDFRTKNVLDVGSSTGGFTDFALKKGAKKVVAVDVGTNQLHSGLRDNPHVELHEQTDIRNFTTRLLIDICVIDVSFISLREVLPAVAAIVGPTAQIIAMVKPQFESGDKLKNKGVIKNEAVRRQILKQFESWAKQRFAITGKADSKVPGEKGNLERFYVLKSR